MKIRYKLTAEAKRITDLFSSRGEVISFAPVRGTRLSAGMDLKVCAELPVVIRPYETVKVGTGLCIWLGVLTDRNNSRDNEQDDGSSEFQAAGLYLPRSSNKGLQLENTVGLLDCDYQEESFLKLYNKTESPIILQPGTRIAQLVIIPVIMDNWLQVEEFEESTERTGGDGSTGVN
jgi:dUTP pyrophosphatase